MLTLEGRGPLMFLFRKTIAFLLLLLLVFHQGLPAQSSDIYFDQAADALDKGEMEQALDFARKARKARPDSSRANLLLGTVLLEMADASAAIKPLKKALDISPADYDAGLNLGIAYFESGRWNKAREIFGKVASLHPDQAEPSINLGILSLRENKLRDARERFANAARIDPKDVRSWNGLSDVYLQMGASKEALEAVKKALRLSPGDEVLRLKAAGLYYEQGKYGEAAAQLKLLRNRSIPEASFIKGCVLYRGGKLEKAKQEFRKALELKKDYPEAKINLGITYYDQRQYEEALAEFKDVLKSHPGNKSALAYFKTAQEMAVEILLKKGSDDFLRKQFAGAGRQWKRALDLDKGNRTARDLLENLDDRINMQMKDLLKKAKKAEEKQDVETAVEAWQEVLELDPEHSKAKKGLGRSAEKAGSLVENYTGSFEKALDNKDWARMRRLINRVARLDKKKSRLLEKKMNTASRSEVKKLSEKARSAEKKDSLSKAVALVKRALRIRPLDTRLKDIQTQLFEKQRKLAAAVVKDGLVFENQGNKGEAMKRYEEALRIAPGNLEARQGRRRLASGAGLTGEKKQAEVNRLYFKGVYAYANGKTSQAVKIWKEALKIETDNDQVLDALAEAEKKQAALAELSR